MLFSQLPALALAAGLCGCSAAGSNPDGPREPFSKQERALISDYRFYLGDTHFHSGFSGDNRSDANPLSAFRAACTRLHPRPGVGGYFLAVTDHVQFTPARDDMGEGRFQELRRQADDPSVDVSGPERTFTALAGAELTGLRRKGTHPAWDDKFGHLNVFALNSLRGLTERSLSWNLTGQEAMDRFSTNPDHLGQFNHPGFADEPPTGDSGPTVFPYTPARDRVFCWFEVSDGIPESWERGATQFNVCLLRGYHVAPTMGSDLHISSLALARTGTVLLAPDTVGVSLSQRRRLLLEAAHQRRGYATEDPSIQIRWSLDGQALGSRLTPRARGDLWIQVEHAEGRELEEIELVADRPGPLDVTVQREDQCVRELRRWQPGQAHFQHSETIDLQGVRYVYLKVRAAGARAMTAPITFY